MTSPTCLRPGPTRSAPPSPTAGSAVTSASRAGSATSTAIEPGCSPSSRSATPTALCGIHRHRLRVARPATARSCQRDLPRRDLRRAARTAGLEQSPGSTTAAGPVSGPRPPPTDRAGRPHRSRRCAGSRRSRRLPSPAHRPAGLLVDFGQNLVGRLRIRCQWTGRAASSPCGTPRCWSTANWRPARCAELPPPTGTRCAAAASETWEPRFTFHGFRYAEIDGWPGELESRGHPGGRAAHRHGAHRLVLLLGSAARSAARERRVEHARQLRRPAHRLPAARRAARLDRRHPGVRADRSVPVRLHRNAGFLAGRRRGRTDASWARSRSMCRRFHLPVPASAGGGLGGRGGDRAVDAVPSATGDLEWLRRQYPSMRAWVDQVDGRRRRRSPLEHRPATGGLARSQRARRTSGGRPAPTAYLVATAYHALTAGLLAAAAAALDLDEDARRYSVSAADVAAAFRQRVRLAERAADRATRRRRSPWRCGSSCSTRPSGTAPAAAWSHSWRPTTTGSQPDSSAPRSSATRCARRAPMTPPTTC